MPAGYSGTPLAKKLGIKAGFRVRLISSPDNLLGLLEPLPEGVTFAPDPAQVVDVVMIFSTEQAHLTPTFAKQMHLIEQNGMIWVAWPKKASKKPTDLTGAIVREVGLKTGLVDTKVCAIDATWSGHKFVIRKENRR